VGSSADHERKKEKLRLGHVTRAFIKKAYHLAGGDADLATAVSEEVAEQHAQNQRGKSRLVRNDLINEACIKLRPMIVEALKQFRVKRPAPLVDIVHETGVARWFEAHKPSITLTEVMIMLRQPKVGAAAITYRVVASLPSMMIGHDQVKRIHEAWVRSRRT
jgi:hypothetical protein